MGSDDSRDLWHISACLTSIRTLVDVSRKASAAQAKNYPHGYLNVVLHCPARSTTEYKPVASTTVVGVQRLLCVGDYFASSRTMMLHGPSNRPEHLVISLSHRLILMRMLDTAVAATCHWKHLSGMD